MFKFKFYVMIGKFKVQLQTPDTNLFNAGLFGQLSHGECRLNVFG